MIRQALSVWRSGAAQPFHFLDVDHIVPPPTHPPRNTRFPALDMAESSLFQTALPHQPIDVMLLVDNSHKMSLIWDDLRDRYLSRLMERLKVANDPQPVRVSSVAAFSRWQVGSKLPPRPLPLSGSLNPSRCRQARPPSPDNTTTHILLCATFT